LLANLKGKGKSSIGIGLDILILNIIVHNVSFLNSCPLKLAKLQIVSSPTHVHQLNAHHKHMSPHRGEKIRGENDGFVNNILQLRLG
jgi:hypothetical protein